MIEKILTQAKAWGFVCEYDLQGNWHILPQQETERWKLQLVGDRWLLLIGDVPQINLHPPEAIIFLSRRWSSSKNLETREHSP
jgi:hypothetical protein